MGVYTTISVCLERDGRALDATTRIGIVRRCVEVELAHGTCTLTLARQPELGLFEKMRSSLFGWWPFETLGERGLQSFGMAPGPHAREFERRWQGPALELAGAVSGLPERTPFLCTAESPRWKGERMDGGFSYVALDEPVEVRTFDAYARGPHPFADPSVGRFHDVLTLTTRLPLDGRSLARSAFVQGLKRDFDLRATCRASHH